MFWIGRDEWDDFVRDTRRMLRNIQQRLDKMALDFTALTAAVSAQTTVIDSVVVAFDALTDKVADLADQLAKAIADNDPAAQAAAQAEIAKLAVDLGANTDKLAAAVPANT